MAAKRKKMKQTSKVDRLPKDGQPDSSPPPAYGPVRGRGGVGRGQGTPRPAGTPSGAARPTMGNGQWS